MDFKIINEAIENTLSESFSDYTREQLIQCASMLRNIATTDDVLRKNDAVILFQAANILEDFDGDVVTEPVGVPDAKAFNVVQESVEHTPEIDAKIKQLPGDFKVAELARYGQINDTQTLNKVLDKELAKLHKVQSAIRGYAERTNEALNNEGVDSYLKICSDGVAQILINGIGTNYFLLDGDHIGRVDGKYQVRLTGSGGSNKYETFYIDVTRKNPSQLVNIIKKRMKRRSYGF